MRPETKMADCYDDGSVYIEKDRDLSKALGCGKCLWLEVCQVIQHLQGSNERLSNGGRTVVDLPDLQLN
jgi:hypothetical protein